MSCVVHNKIFHIEIDGGAHSVTVNSVEIMLYGTVKIAYTT